jgi:serine/threonine-protein kinase RsbW
MGELIVPGELSQIPRIQDFVRQAATQAGLSEDSIYHCQLATDEACTNVIEHGYAKFSDRPSLTLNTSLDQSFFCITIIDQGPDFNPLTLLDRQPTTEMKSSGWGIHFIRSVMDKAEYKRLDNHNYLSLYKRLPKSSR